MMARFSTGSLGALVRGHAESNGLDLSASVSTDDPTTLAFATLDEHGHASYDFYVDGTADWGWTADELAQAARRRRRGPHRLGRGRDLPRRRRAA